MDNFNDEVEQFKKNHPEIDYIDVIFPDINATPRGKRISIESLNNISAGIPLPLSTITLDSKGQVLENAGLGEDLGEPDFLCFPVLGSLRSTHNDRVGQVLVSMYNDQATAPHHLSPRNILSNLVDKLHSKNLFPVIAMELEFYIIDKKRCSNHEIQTAMNPIKEFREKDTKVHDIESLDDYFDFLTELNSECKKQGLNTTGTVSESAPGQFEINFLHSSNILETCDNIVFAKRLIKQIAHRHDFHATFMAKPFNTEAGSGKHVHMSVLDEHGNNIFSNKEGAESELFKQCLAAMINQIPASIALLCPNVNSYRRFSPNLYVPLKADWGHNHRNTALRIPISNAQNRRIEHRIAGADVNPYILVAIVISSLDQAENFTPESCPPELEKGAKKFPARMSEALNSLKNSSLADIFGQDFIEMYIDCKTEELQEFEAHVTSLEIDWMLHTA
jgi:gamma-glutamylputrescine synthase